MCHFGIKRMKKDLRNDKEKRKNVQTLQSGFRGVEQRMRSLAV